MADSGLRRSSRTPKPSQKFTDDFVTGELVARKKAPAVPVREDTGYVSEGSIVSVSDGDAEQDPAEVSDGKGEGVNHGYVSEGSLVSSDSDASDAEQDPDEVSDSDGEGVAVDLRATGITSTARFTRSLRRKRLTTSAVREIEGMVSAAQDDANEALPERSPQQRSSIQDMNARMLRAAIQSVVRPECFTNPQLLADLYPHQVEAITAFNEETRSFNLNGPGFLLADAAGAGKTLQAVCMMARIVAAEELGVQVGELR